MKTAFFLAHDPGGADVVVPVADWFKQQGLATHVCCVGPAALLQQHYAATEAECLHRLEAFIMNKELSLLVTGTSWNSDFEIHCLRYCRQNGIPTATILDYWTNYKLRCTDKEGHESYPDHYIVMDEWACREAIDEGVPKNIVRVLGQPGLDRFVQRKGSVPSARGDAYPRKALFLSQPLSQLYGASLGYDEKSVISDLVSLFHLRNDWRLLIKFHPKDGSELRSEYGHYAVEGDLVHWIEQVDLVMGMNSMGLLHAYLLNKPVISYQPNLQSADLCITNKLKLTKLIPSYAELEASFERLADERCSNVDQFEKPIWLDGCSTERIGMFLKGIAI